ncbi:MAG: site-specific integrase [Lentisphaeria bacterium]|nr:site-specific integrase [Lentisphaeria bacterium]
MGAKTRPLTEEEFSRFLGVILNPGPHELVYAAIICLILGIGARIGEVLELRDCDAFEPNGSPRRYVTRTLEKKRSKDPQRLSTFFPWEAIGGPVVRWRADVFRRFVFRREDRLFSVRNSGRPVSRYRVWHYNRIFLKRAGIEPRGVALHGLRKTFLTLIYFQRRRAGCDGITALRKVQQLAGHASFEETLHYIGDDVFVSHEQVSADAFNRILNRNNSSPLSETKVNRK